MSFSEWKTYKIEELCRRIISGGTPSTTKKEYYGGDIPWLKTQEVNFNRIYDTDTKITKEGFENSSAKMIEPNSIIVAMYGATAAKLAINKIPLSTNQACCNLTVDEKKADYHFLYYYLRNEYSNLVNLTNGGAQQNLSSGVIKNFEIKAPDLKTQQRIASILSSLDDAIELNQQINKTLEEMAKAIFKEWFVDFNYPNATGKFQETEIGKIPVGWKVGKLGDVVETKGGTTPSTTKKEYWDGEYYWTSPRDLSNLQTNVLLDTSKKITALGLKQISSGILPKGTLLLSSRAPIGYLAISEVPISINQGFIAINGTKVSNLFMLYWLKENMQTIINNANGSTFLEISKTVFRNIPIAIPSGEVLEKFEEIVSSIFNQILNNEKENQSLMNLRDTLLPKLMKGEININL